MLSAEYCVLRTAQSCHSALVFRSLDLYRPSSIVYRLSSIVYRLSSRSFRLAGRGEVHAGWVLDGGAPLIVVYVLALSIALATSWRLAIDRRRRHGVWLEAAVLTGYNVASIAVTFNYPLFISQAGLEFWLFNALLYAASRPNFGLPAEGGALRREALPRRSRRPTAGT